MTRNTSRTLVGHVASIRCYPVKSMQGEVLQRVNVGPAGLDGDRRFAVIDTETGRVASAKNPRKWPRLLELSAEMSEGELIITSDTSAFHRDRDNLEASLSQFLERDVTLRSTPLVSAAIEIHWPSMEGLANAGTESVYGLPPGGYFDLAPIHILTTATLNRLRELTPDADFNERRFRPNIVIQTLPELAGFVETNWLGRNLFIGEMQLEVTTPCSRCVMTTLAQPGIAADPRVLRAAVMHNSATVGVYASTGGGGEIALGSQVWLE